MKWHLLSFVLALAFLSSCGRRGGSNGSSDESGEPCPELTHTAAQDAFELSMVVFVFVGALFVVVGLGGMVFKMAVQSQTGFRIPAKAMYAAIAMGIGLMATALALEVIMWPLVWGACAALLGLLVWAIVWAVRAVRDALNEAPPESGK